MKIALVHPQLNYFRGAERLVVLIANHLAERGHETHIFVRAIPSEGSANMLDGIMLGTDIFDQRNFPRLSL